MAIGDTSSGRRGHKSSAAMAEKSIPVQLTPEQIQTIVDALGDAWEALRPVMNETVDQMDRATDPIEKAAPARVHWEEHQPKSNRLRELRAMFSDLKMANFVGPVAPTRR
jgi:hypothetical protein